MRDLSPSDVIKPEVRGLTAYTLKHFKADVKLDQNENPYELPADLKNTNVVGALGPREGSLYDLIDSPTLSVVQGLGDAGGMTVRFRDSWCSVASVGAQTPFRLDHLISCIRPLL